MLLSQFLISSGGSARPKLRKRSSMLLLCDQAPARLVNAVPLNTLPPVLGMMLTTAPPVSASPRPPDRFIVISWLLVVSGT